MNQPETKPSDPRPERVIPITTASDHVVPGIPVPVRRFADQTTKRSTK